MGSAIGVDLGDWITKIAHWDDQKNKAIPLRNGLVRSALFFNPYTGTYDIRRQDEKILKPAFWISDLIRKHRDQNELIPQNLAEEISISNFFKKIKHISEEFFRDEVDRVVIAVKAGLEEIDRAHIKSSVEKAGFKIVRLVDQVIPLAIYSSRFNPNKTNKVFAYYLGTKEFTVNILTIQGLMFQIQQVETVNTISSKRIDAQISHLIIDKLFKSQAVNQDDEELVADISNQICEQKHHLKPITPFNIRLAKRIYSVKIPRSEIEKLIKTVVEESICISDMLICQHVDIAETWVYGGVTNFGVVHRMLKTSLPTPVQFLEEEQTKAIAFGAANYSRYLLDT